MARVFDSFHQLYDVQWLEKQSIVIFGGGRVGSKVITRLARAGVGAFVAVDGDLISIHNVCYGYPLSSAGLAKVTGLRQIMEEINPNIVYVPVRRRVRLRNLGIFQAFISQARCVLIAIESFVIAAELARFVYGQTACVAAMELGGVEVGDIGFSFPGRTPCLDCSMHLRRRVAGHGGQARPDAIDLLATITTKYILALCLREHRGYEHYRHLLDPSRCRGLVYNGPNDFISQARDDFPFYYQLLDVVTAEHRPSCSVCRGYSLQPF